MTTEQAILAYFKSPEDAQIAAERIQHELDVDDVQIDRISGVPGDGNDVYNNPINGNIASLATLTNSADSLSSRDTGVLLGSSPAESGMSDGSRGEMISGYDVLLTVVCPKDKLDQALNIINACGGRH